MSDNLRMTPDLEQLLREQMATGRFQTASEAVVAALRLMKERAAVSDVTDDAFGLWKDRGQDGLAYQREIRAEWSQ